MPRNAQTLKTPRLKGFTFGITGLALLSLLIASNFPPAAPKILKEDLFSFSSAQTIGFQSTGTHGLYLPMMMYHAPTVVLDGRDWYLVVDDAYISRREVPRRYHPFKKHPLNPIMVADRNWEGQIIQLYGTVLREDRFRMWYSSLNAVKKTSKALYAESQDGLTWIKPPLDEDGKNLVIGDSNLISVINRPADSGQLYRLMMNADESFYGYWSTDGILLNAYAENPVFSVGSDVAQFYWDPETSLYRGTVKQKMEIRNVTRRIVGFVHSLDFIHWDLLPKVFIPDKIDDLQSPGFFTHFYGLPVFRAGEHYLGLLWVLKARDLEGLYGPVHIQIVSSTDGLQWFREESPRPPILELGPPGAWDDGQIYTAVSPVVVGDEFWLYYSGCNLEHGAPLLNMVCSIGLATAPYNRLASLYGTGTILTAYITAPGAQLHLNYEGTVRVELVSAGKTIPGYEAANSRVLTGDSLNETVTWKNRTTLPDQPFQIRFYLDGGALYAYKME